MIRNTILWILIVAYVVALPYGIIPFNYLRESLSLAVVKVIPIIIMLSLALFYLTSRRLNQLPYQIGSVIVPGILLIALVFLIESNPIKYLHIPEYMLLTWLLYLVTVDDDHQLIRVITAACCASLIGLIDEVHHGLHAERYFGAKDMFINAAGSTIGALSINAKNSKGSFDRDVISKLISNQPQPFSLLLVSLLVSLISVFKLLEITKTSFYLDSYPLVLFLCNLIVIGLSVYFLCRPRREPTADDEFKHILIIPTIILMVLHGLIAFAYVSGMQFK